MADVAGVTMDEVLRVAELANLDLTTQEVPLMQRDLNAILGHIAQLNELDTAAFRRWPRWARCWAQRASRPAQACARMRCGSHLIARR